MSKVFKYEGIIYIIFKKIGVAIKLEENGDEPDWESIDNLIKRIPEEDINYYDKSDMTLLMYYVCWDDYENVKILLDKGADPNLGNEQENPLSFAVCNNNYDMVKLLIKYEADVNIYNDDQKRPILDAARICNYDIINLLIQEGARVWIRDRWGTSPIYFTSSRCAKTTQLLLENNAHPDTSNKYGSTCLMTAVKSNQFDIAQLLIDYNADVNKVSKDGKTALDFATDNNIIRLLKEHI